MEWMIGTALIQCPQRDATHLANFDEKVHKPQSRLSISATANPPKSDDKYAQLIRGAFIINCFL